MRQQPRIALLLLGCMAVVALIFWLNGLGGGANPEPVATGSTEATAQSKSAPDDRTTAHAERALLLIRLRDALDRLLAKPDTVANEAVLTFANDAAYQRFLERAAQKGLEIVSRIDRLRTARVRIGSRDALWADIADYPGDYAEIAANAYMRIPGIPDPQDRNARIQIPFGDTTLAFLGIRPDHGDWGRGITIAVIDTGVAADATFGHRLRYLDIGFGTIPGNGDNDGHGTAVAALAAGASPDANGVAPGADILSIRVTGANGVGDTFAVAQAIIAAADAGAQVLNISLGAYSGSALLSSAIDYALARGVVITAAAGNDQAAQLTWPAADPRVVSVGAVDALEQQVLFSNSGDQLKIAAPGYGVDTAWLDGRRVSISGTSASSPLVAGAIAALMSENTGLTAAQAWTLLQHHSNDTGAPGADPEFGNGVLNVGWAMDSGDITRVDTAVSSLYYDASSSSLEIVVQNRSGQGIAGAQLDVTAGQQVISRKLDWLPPGGSTVVKIDVDPSLLQNDGNIPYRAILTNPAGIVDQVPGNNQRSTVLHTTTDGG